MKELKQLLPQLYSDMQQDMKLFKRETYQEHFESYQERNRVLFARIDSLLACGEEQSEAIQREIAASLTACANDMLVQQQGKIAKENLLMNLKMVTVLYVIPCIKASQSEQADALADAVCTEWNQCFKDQIKAATQQSIQEGFRSKLCYITTAVCESLHKTEDCYELTLLKNYRDTYLIGAEGGEELIQDYYNIAPTIVKRMNRSKHSDSKYRSIWESYLKPCIALIEEGRNEECRILYQSMVETLHKEYMEDYYA